MMPETLREESVTKMTQSNMKKMLVNQAQGFGPPNSAPNVRRRSTRTDIHPTDVAKNTINEKLSPAAFWILKGSRYAMKLYAVSISHGTPMPTYMFTELLQVMFAMAESAVVCLSAAILLATKSGHDVPLASAVNAMT